MEILKEPTYKLTANCCSITNTIYSEHQFQTELLNKVCIGFPIIAQYGGKKLSDQTKHEQKIFSIVGHVTDVKQNNPLTFNSW